MTSLLPEFFRRHDEDPDARFYAVPRVDSHLDAHGDAVVAGWYDDLLPTDGRVLDLFAGAVSHLPARCRDVVGVGLDGRALERNAQLAQTHLLDLNADPRLPFETASLAAAVCTVSVQYLTRPHETLAEVARCLRPGAPFAVAFSNRMFPSKAVLCWRASDDAAHVRLVRGYFAAAGGFGGVSCRSYVPDDGGFPLYLLWAPAEPAVPPG